MKRWSVILLVALVAALGIGACQPGAPASVALTKVKLQLSWVEQAQFAGYYVARDKGFYAAEGLDVEILPGGPNVSTIQQISGGAADFGIDGVLALYQARDSGLDIVSIAQTDQKDGFIKVARKSSGITKAEDFKGKKVGNFPDEWEFDALTAKLGLKPGTDFTFVQQGFTMDPFISGELDVASATMWNEYNILIEGPNPKFKPEDLNIIHYDDYGVATPHDAVLTSGDMVSKNRDTAVKFLRASTKGWLDAYADEKGAIDIVMKVVLAGTEQSSREHQELMLKAMKTLQLPEGTTNADFGKIDDSIYASAKTIAETYLKLKNPVDLSKASTKDILADSKK